jgi:arylsulfatase A-like enzyme
MAKISASALLAWQGLRCTTARGDGGARKPNFVVILTDDQGYQALGCYGAKKFKTPHVDCMAAGGMRFTDFYSAAPVCTPARAALLTGCYPPWVNMETVLFPDSKTGLNPAEQTLPRVLKAAGYTTACIGKWHLGHLPEFLPLRHGFDEFFGLPYSNDLIPADQPGGRAGSTYPPLPMMEGDKTVQTNPDQRLLTRRFTSRAVDFIKRQGQRPFFLYVAHSMPHVPVFASDQFAGKSLAGKYGDAMEEIDWSTGEILRTIRDLGVEKDTVVLFTSDNGPWLRSGKYGDLIPADEEGSALPLRGGKFTTYEGGMRVPCVAYAPGRVPAAKTCSELCGTIDLLPTFARMAGAPLRDGLQLDGKDIGSVLAGDAKAKSPHASFYYSRSAELQAIRRGHWKLLSLPAPQSGQQRVLELYDLANDIAEARNLAAANPALVVDLQQAMTAFDADLKANRRPLGRTGGGRR